MQAARTQKTVNSMKTNCSWTTSKIHRTAFLSAIVAFTLLFQAASTQAQTVYATSSSSRTTSDFGTLDLATGVFSLIATTGQEFFGITTGAGGTIFGTDVNSGHLYTNSPTGVTTQFGTSVAPAGLGFQGLAYSSAGNNFFADNRATAAGGGNTSLYSISGNGNSNSLVGTMATPPDNVTSGSIAFGPSGSLYFDYATVGLNAALYTVDTSTGMTTAVGSGLGTNLLTLFSVGSTLYGIDTTKNLGIPIYTINTTTGVATATGVNVTGLKPFYFLDTATFVPDTGSTFGLLCLALAALFGASRLRFLRSA